MKSNQHGLAGRAHDLGSKCAIGLGLLLMAAAAVQAQSNPYQKGPDPTSSSLNA